MNTPKTLEEHCTYLYKSIRLQLWFLHAWLAGHPDETFSGALRTRVDICRKTDCFPGTLINEPDFSSESWRCLEKCAEAVYRENLFSRTDFENAAFEIFRGAVARRCERDFLDSTHRELFTDGFLRTNPAIYPSHPGILTFHIANVCEPDSFFDSTDYMRKCFLRMLERAEQEVHAERIGTETWLNEVDKWLAWFPEEWHIHMGAPNLDVKWHNGFWGQFINRRGCFNDRYGDLLRQTGRLPFSPRFSWCDIASFKTFLQKK